MSNDIRWEDPPPRMRGSQATSRLAGLEQAAKELVDNPGRWAVVWEGRCNAANYLAVSIRRGVKPFDMGMFDAQSRLDPPPDGDGERTARVYARCVAARGK